MNDQIFICSDLLERIIYLLSEISISGILKGGLRCSLLLFDQKKKKLRSEGTVRKRIHTEGDFTINVNGE